MGAGAPPLLVPRRPDRQHGLDQVARRQLAHGRDVLAREAALNGENTFLTRLAGTAEQASRQSDYRTIQRVQ